MDLLIFLYLVCVFPKLVFLRLWKGKKHPAFFKRLGIGLPRLEKDSIWIHAVSVGEIKAAEPLVLELKKKYPKSPFCITTTTESGFEQAKRTFKMDAFLLFGPIDLSFVVKRFIRAIRPIHYIVIESDFWPNLLKALKKRGVQTSLVSGKMSDLSFRRFSRVSFFAKSLFRNFDEICVQNEMYQSRFLAFCEENKVHVTGNLKLDFTPLKDFPHLKLPSNSIVISCTHAPEEEWILDRLIESDYFFILAPRHPERFKEVEVLLQKKSIPYTRWKDRAGSLEKVLLVDVLGELASCYQAARLAILGGSFVSHIGGHNVLEPLLYSTPVFFGPFMHGQREFASRALQSGAGFQVSLENLKAEVDRFFSDSDLESKMKNAALLSLKEGRGSTQKTLLCLGRSQRFALDSNSYHH